MTPTAPLRSRLGRLSDELARLQSAVRRSGDARPASPELGDAGLSATERIGKVIDSGGPWFEVGALRGYDRRDSPDAGVGLMTGIGTVRGNPVLIAASTPSNRGAWWPETVDKLLRAQEIAFRQQLPIAYLLEGTSPGLPLDDGIFPGGFGPGRVLAMAGAMRRSGKVPQVTARFGGLSGAGALLADLGDQSIDVATTGLDQVRSVLAALPPVRRITPACRPVRPPGLPPEQAHAVLPTDHRRSYDMDRLLRSLLDGGELEEFQPRHAIEMLCGHGWIEGIPVALIVNRRGVIPARSGPPRLGGIIYAESATKVAYFIETASRQDLPILFVQDVSGFMLGVEAEHSGIIRAGAELVEAMATAKSARIALTVNHASGAGYYAMASQGFEPDFTLAWPTGRIGAMEAEAAITAAHGTAIAKVGGEAAASEAVRASIAKMRQTFERELDAIHAAARGHVDAIITPAETR